ncbi:hypothetical protein Cgig2_024059 [Carnegiea gigantea]|uniref:CCHC-type domain-containing protein n=1 Tax=Carnegiea gigantea TaxID=171969 RepID=A0A9Q1QLJ7_9CARY|nr:hypothetical protein Cgig2_024059 [Carnegiea gigantea]
MAAKLEAAWSRLRLKEEEEKVMLHEDEVQNDKNEDTALCLLYLIREFARKDMATSCRVEKALNFMVDIDVRKPLRGRVKKIIQQRQIWIKFKYMKLPDFCYACGHLGHVFRRCEMFDDDVPETGLQYGIFLRSSLLKSRRQGIETEIQEEH